jgi:hypothetical protein
MPAEYYRCNPGTVLQSSTLYRLATGSLVVFKFNALRADRRCCDLGACFSPNSMCLLASLKRSADEK